MALQLVVQGLTKRLSSGQRRVTNAADAFLQESLCWWKRGSFPPGELVTNDILDCARALSSMRNSEEEERRSS